MRETEGERYQWKTWLRYNESLTCRPTNWSVQQIVNGTCQNRGRPAEKGSFTPRPLPTDIFRVPAARAASVAASCASCMGRLGRGGPRRMPAPRLPSRGAPASSCSSALPTQSEFDCLWLCVDRRPFRYQSTRVCVSVRSNCGSRFSRTLLGTEGHFRYSPGPVRRHAVRVTVLLGIISPTSIPRPIWAPSRGFFFLPFRSSMPTLQCVFSICWRFSGAVCCGWLCALPSRSGLVLFRFIFFFFNFALGQRRRKGAAEPVVVIVVQTVKDQFRHDLPGNRFAPGGRIRISGSGARYVFFSFWSVRVIRLRIDFYVDMMVHELFKECYSNFICFAKLQDANSSFICTRYEYLKFLLRCF